MWLGWSDVATGGLFTLAGVLVGLVGGALVDIAIERRRERRELRQARRLVTGELHRVLIHLDGLVKAGKYPLTMGESEAAPFLPDALWVEYRAALARLEDDAVAYQAVAVVLDTIAVTRDLIGAGDAGAALPAELQQRMATSLDLTRGAYKALTGEPSPI